jgi:hypothetical protein
LSRGRYLGLRKIDDARMNWIARLRTDGGSQNYKRLGYLGPGFDWDDAKNAALQWFRSHDAGVKESGLTIEAICGEYVRVSIVSMTLCIRSIIPCSSLFTSALTDKSAGSIRS